MSLNKLTTLLVSSLFLISCTATDYGEISHGLPKVEDTHLDGLYAMKGLDLQGLSLAPVRVSYKHNRSTEVIYNDEDYELTDADIKTLQARTEKAFGKYFPAGGPYTLEIHFDQLQLAAPLREDPLIAKTFVEESGYVTIRGLVRRKGGDGEVVASFVDKQVLGQHRDNFEMQRFTSVLFWHDMQIGLRRLASNLQRGIN